MKNSKEILDYLTLHYRYDDENGVFIVKRTNKPFQFLSSRSDGKKAYFIELLGVKHQVGRLAWLYANGEFPKRLYYLDGDILNNRIENLSITKNRGVKTVKPKMTRKQLPKTTVTGDILLVSHESNGVYSSDEYEIEIRDNNIVLYRK